MPNPRFSRIYPKVIPYFAATILLGLASFGLSTNAASAGSAAVPPAPEVEVVVLQPQGIRTWVKFSGRIAPVESAAIRPLVGGIIQEVLFREGEHVAKGQPLFVIDPRTHLATVEQAKAKLAVAQSRATLAQDELARSQQLVDDNLISRSIYDAAFSAKQVADADIKLAEAALSQAKLNLEYAHIRAPIAGRVSRAELTIGNVVEAGPNAPVLTQIVATEQMFAEFNVDEATYIAVARSSENTRAMPVQLTLANDEGVIYDGHIASFDNHLDTASGTIRARALFDNRDGALTAGMFANVLLGSASTSEALLLPSRAVGTNQSKKFVLVVDANNTATYREVTLGDYYQSQRVVLAGLSAGDKVIVNGLSHVRPNTVVSPRDVSAELLEAQVVANP